MSEEEIPELSVEAIIQGVSRLPAAPQILPRLRELLHDPNSALEDITRLLKLDASLAAQVVRVSNSAYYGASTPCKDVESAVNRIGFNEVFKLVGAVVARQVLRERLLIYNLESEELWRMSVAAANAMTALSVYSGIESEAAYTVGLLHGIGKIVISTFCDEQGYESAMSGIRAINPEEELEFLGFTHADVAEGLLSKWNFPREVITPIASQINPSQASEDYRGLAYLLYFTLQVIELLMDDPDTIEQTFDPDPLELNEIAVTTEDLVEATVNALHMVDTLSGTLE